MKLKKIINNTKGFSLVEIIIIIAILAVIITIATPNVIMHMNNSKKTTDVSNADLVARLIIKSIADADTITTINNISADGELSLSNTNPHIKSAIDELQNLPKPIYNNGSLSDSFYVEIKTDGIVKVYADSSGNIELYPDIHSDWK
ncbi:MAG: prepilin-type N-terminal cleavage/methylation domain-containing protein [Halanaerobiales bacterium]